MGERRWRIVIGEQPADLVIDAEMRRGTFSLMVNVTVDAGQVVGVLGPNGAGKSTLLSALAGLLPVARGWISLGGRTLDDSDSGIFAGPADRNVGFVFQNYRLFPHLTVLDNVAFAPAAHGTGKGESRAIAQEWLHRLGLSQFADRKPRDLSGGQAQRVALARALAGSPGLLLLDEPLSALDARTRLEVQSELRRHLSEFAGPCLLVTHDPLEALVLADRLLVLEEGRVVQDGSPSEVTRRPATEYVAKLVGLNLYAGTAVNGRVDLVGGGTFAVPGAGHQGEVLVAVRPSAVQVGLHEPHDTSARNVWRGTVSGLTLLADRVRLDLEGSPNAVVDVTAAAVADLRLDPGAHVWLTVKATDLDVYSHRQRDRSTQ